MRKLRNLPSQTVLTASYNVANDNSAPRATGVSRGEPGDTLWDIAATYLGSGTRYPEIKALNALQTNVIRAGQVLSIPIQDSKDSEKLYRVKRGDSLWSIAEMWLGDGSRYKEIRALNGLSSDTILPGQELKLPKEN